MSGLAPFASADPLDPTWRGGIFNAGDYDDVVPAVMAMTGGAEAGPTLESPRQPSGYRPPDLARLSPPAVPLQVRPIRAPPTA
jgi:hypothetical protein